MAESTRMVLGLGLGILVMIILVAKTKVHSFIAMLIAALITGIIGGMPILTVKVAGKTTVGVINAISTGFGNTLACGLQLTHVLVPPTPGPLTAAGMLGIDVGQMIAGGTILSIPMLLVIVPYCKWIGKKIYQVVNEDDEYVRPQQGEQVKLASTELLDQFLNRTDLPGLAISAAPIVVPLVMILTKTVLDLMGADKSAGYYYFVALFGSPIVALMIGTLIAIYGLVSDRDTKEVLKMMDDGIKDTGIIMLITGVGGSLGYVVRASGIGNVLGQMVVTWPVPAVLIPFCIAALMRICLGSATVAIVTSASLTMPLMSQLTISPLLMALSCCVGAISFGYFTDSGFWVWNGMFGVSDLKEQLQCKTAVSMIMAGVGLLELLVAQYFI